MPSLENKRRKCPTSYPAPDENNKCPSDKPYKRTKSFKARGCFVLRASSNAFDESKSGAGRRSRRTGASWSSRTSSVRKDTKVSPTCVPREVREFQGGIRGAGGAMAHKILAGCAMVAADLTGAAPRIYIGSGLVTVQASREQPAPPIAPGAG